MQPNKDHAEVRENRGAIRPADAAAITNPACGWRVGPFIGYPVHVHEMTVPASIMNVCRRWIRLPRPIVINLVCILVGSGLGICFSVFLEEESTKGDAGCRSVGRQANSARQIVARTRPVLFQPPEASFTRHQNGLVDLLAYLRSITITIPNPMTWLNISNKIGSKFDSQPTLSLRNHLLRTFHPCPSPKHG